MPIPRKPPLLAPHFVFAGGLEFQVLPGADHAAGFGPGFGAHFELGDVHRIFAGLRAAMIIEVDLKPTASRPFTDPIFPYNGEIGMELGYRARFSVGGAQVGPIAWLEGQYWSYGPYVGAKAGIMIEGRRRFVMCFTAGDGALEGTPTEGVFSAGAEFGIRAF